ncbi:MAG: hypothetical protein ACP5VS_14535 [Desulfomonilaceae bacterium]
MGLKVKILEKHCWGGRLGLARKMENILVWTRPYTGAQVVSRLLIQLRKKGLSKELEECQSIDYSNGNFILN